MIHKLALLLAGAILVLGAACGDDGNGNGDPGSGNGEDGTAGPSPTIQQSGLGILFIDQGVAFETPEPGETQEPPPIPSHAVGDTIRVVGLNWDSSEPITFYIGTPDQAAEAARSVATGIVPQIGEATPEADGTVTFEFQLEDSYDVEGGDRLTIQSGEGYALLALQGTTGIQVGSFDVP